MELLSLTDATTLDVELLPWQTEVFNDPTRFKIVAAGRRCGKTRLAIWTLLINALQAAKGHVFYVAPTQGQARDILWNDLLELGTDIIVSSHINNLQVKLINGATISLKGADRPETMRGVSLKYLVLDEYADMKPGVFEQILRPALTDQKGGALFIGTPMGRNHFYDLYIEASLGKDDTFKAWHFTSYDNPLLDSAEIDVAKLNMSSYSFRQEYMASFEAAGSEMFKEEWLRFSEDEPEEGDYYITVDLAGFEDKTQTLKHNRPIAVGIEKGIAKQAVISPLTDLMKQHQTYFRVEELTHGNKKKTDRVMWALQGRFENKRITLNVGEWNPTFLDQLFQFPNKLVHDDLIDSLAYIDQIATIAYNVDFDEEAYLPLDAISGF